MSEAETYNFVTSEKRGRGYGSGVHKEYTFVDDPEVVAETLQADIRLEQAEHEENLVKSVVNAQIDDFFEEINAKRHRLRHRIHFAHGVFQFPD